MDMHDTSQLGSRDFFSHDTMTNMLPYGTYGKCFGFQHGLRRFKQYLIVGRYLGAALNGLSLL